MISTKMSGAGGVVLKSTGEGVVCRGRPIAPTEIEDLCEGLYGPGVGGVLYWAGNERTDGRKKLGK